MLGHVFSSLFSPILRLFTDPSKYLYHAIQSRNAIEVDRFLSAQTIPEYQNIECHAGNSSLPLLLSIDCPAILEKLVRTYNDQISSEEKNLALNSALLTNHPPAVITLLQMCKNDISTHNKGFTLLYAIEKNHEKILEMVCNFDNDEIDNDVKGLALYTATEKGNAKFVSMLLQQWSKDIHKTHKQKAMQLIAKNGDIAIANKLLSQWNEHDELWGLADAIKNGHFDIALMMIERCKNNLDNISRITALTAALEIEHSEFTKILTPLCKPKSINRMLKDFIIENNEKAISAVFKGMLEINNQEKGKLLILAAQKGRTSIIKMILHFASKVITNNEKIRALNRASKSGHFETIRALLDDDSITSIPGFDNNLPLEIVREQIYERKTRFRTSSCR